MQAQTEELEVDLGQQVARKREVDKAQGHQGHEDSCPLGACILGAGGQIEQTRGEVSCVRL